MQIGQAKQDLGNHSHVSMLNYLIKTDRIPHEADIHPNDREICAQGKFGKFEER